MQISEKSLHYYQTSINRVISFIFANINKAITLDELSKISCFSKYHFHRIFQAIVGQSTGEFISRVRIEKAAYHLIYNPSAPITQIALDCGFSSSQNFARSFRSYYNINPGQYRKVQKHLPLDSNSNPGNIYRNNGNERNVLSEYFDVSIDKLITNETYDEIASQVIVKSIEDMTVAYIRKKANYTPAIITDAFKELSSWGCPRGYINSDTNAVSVYWDNVAVTPVDKRMFDVCIPIDSSVTTSPPVHKQIITGGLYAVYHAEINDYNFYYHWNRFLKFWFPSSGFIPDERPCYERIYNLFKRDSGSTLNVDICVPIKQL